MRSRRAAAVRCGKPAASEGGRFFQRGITGGKKGRRVRKSEIPGGFF